MMKTFRHSPGDSGKLRDKVRYPSPDIKIAGDAGLKVFGSDLREIGVVLCRWENVATNGSPQNTQLC